HLSSGQNRLLPSFPTRRSSDLRDDPHVDPDDLAAADPLDLPLLQKPQQLHLEWHAHLGDLVEEQRAAVGQLESALTLDVGARVSAFLMAEQLGLEQRLGDGATV